MDGEKLYAEQRQHLERNPAECFSGEVNSRDGVKEKMDAGGGGSSIETGKKRTRGRPPGSKNKPKQPAVVTPDAEATPATRPYILEIPGGGDVSGALAGFARRRGLGVCVLAGTGAVSNVSLRHPSPSAEGGATIVFRGRHDILSISATYLPPSMSEEVARAFGGLTVSLAGPHGQILGGAVAGPLVAATTVMVVAATFTNPTFHRLSADDFDFDAPASVSGSGEADKHHGLQLEPQGQHHASRLQTHSMAAAATAAQPVSLYAGQSHVARAPAASKSRPRPPYE